MNSGETRPFAPYTLGGLAYNYIIVGPRFAATLRRGEGTGGFRSHPVRFFPWQRLPMPSSPHEGATATVFCHPTHRDRRQRQDRPMKRNTKMAGRELRQEQAIASGGGMRRGKRGLTEEKVGHDLAWAEEAPATART